MTSIVYPYVRAMARGEELRYSLRSVDQFFPWPVDVWVVGDLPDWYDGNYLACPLYDPQRIMPRQDRAKKMFRAVNEPGIDNEFLWMMDDIYFIRPIEISDLKRPWICGFADPDKLEFWRPGSEWGRQKQQTWRALIDNGRPTWDFCTHLPHVYTKDRLLELDEIYNLKHSPVIDDLVYENHFMPFDEKPLNCSEILYRETRKPAAEILNRRLSRFGTKVFNHVDRAYTHGVEQVLIERFPNPSRWECQR